MELQESILVVDDDVDTRESLRMILQQVYKVYTAANGQEALQCLQKENIDLVTLDLQMPQFSGVEVLREIRKLRPNPDLEIIIITGHGTLENAQEIIQYGVMNFICKPFEVTEIISTVDKCFQRQKEKLKIENLIQHIRDLRTLLDNKEGDPGLKNRGKESQDPGIGATSEEEEAKK